MKSLVIRMKNKKVKTLVLVELILRIAVFLFLTLLFIALSVNELINGNENLWKSFILLMFFFLGTLFSIGNLIHLLKIDNEENKIE